MRPPAAALLLTLVAASAVVLPAEAQERRRRSSEPSITLYDEPNFLGRSITLYADTANLAGLDFNDRARSARIEGSWRLCEDKNFRSRCEPFAEDVRDFTPYRFNATISSLQQVGGRPGRPGFEGPAVTGRPVIGRDGVDGQSVVFFRRPSQNGLDVVADGQGSADAFCRQVGLKDAVYFHDRDRAREALGRDGRVYANVPVLRDVLCRR